MYTYIHMYIYIYMYMYKYSHFTFIYIPIYIYVYIYGTRASEPTQRKEWQPPLHLSVVAIEKGVFRSTATTVDQLYIFIIIFYCYF